MKHCSHCGKELVDNDIYCSTCGNKVDKIILIEKTHNSSFLEKCSKYSLFFLLTAFICNFIPAASYLHGSNISIFRIYQLPGWDPIVTFIYYIYLILMIVEIIILLWKYLSKNLHMEKPIKIISIVLFVGSLFADMPFIAEGELMHIRSLSIGAFLPPILTLGCLISCWNKDR